MIFNEPEKVTAISYSGFEDADPAFINKVLSNIEQLRNLEAISISNCSLEGLPDGLVKLKKLNCILLSEVKFENAPVVLSRLRNIECFSSCNSIDLDTIDLRLTGIKNLYLDGCLDRISEGLTNIPSLEILSVRNSKLTIVPPSIGRLKNLKKLYLDNTKLKKLPDELGKLKELELLTIRGTDIAGIPESLFSINKLVIAISSGCPDNFYPFSMESIIELMNRMPDGWEVRVVED
jgi:Leucine-rich repeat (LRR) protein